MPRPILSDTVIRIDNTLVRQAIGARFSKLVVICFMRYKRCPNKRSRVPYVLCRCDCGREKTISLWDIKAGKIKTCGLNHPHYDDRSMPAFNFIYSMYQRRSVKLSGNCPLTKEQFRGLTQQACHYCGRPPISVSYRGQCGRCNSGLNISQYVYNGLDRKDSSEGYTISNVVPCCGTCNHAKHTMSYHEFIAWINHLVLFRSVK